ncbi:hypothetical protein OGAPHI_006708 [Ogataea philodendri]|uniref:Uncharacterized protein n=1 Tax=Ogataea philodendri TaxID=1378263 RepID=A0A9P8NY08_9ASCO|nr:uncharacterized protein OGAPHI_006708 [Ogataea philodendri]KAH3661301.1 hypothetical protein OGAPHI_006708 [Ogataea philodendri]
MGVSPTDMGVSAIGSKFGGALLEIKLLLREGLVPSWNVADLGKLGLSPWTLFLRETSKLSASTTACSTRLAEEPAFSRPSGNIITIRVLRVIVEGKVTGQHSVQDHTTGPHVDFASFVRVAADDQFWCCVTGGATTCFHQVCGSESVDKPKVCDDDIFVFVQQEIFELQVSVDDPLCVHVVDSGNQLSKQPTGHRFFQVPVFENVVEKFTSGGVFQHNSDVFVVLKHLFQPHDVGMCQFLQSVNFAVDLVFLFRALGYGVSTDQFDGSLGRLFAIFAPSEFDFAKLAFTNRRSQHISSKSNFLGSSSLCSGTHTKSRASR